MAKQKDVAVIEGHALAVDYLVVERGSLKPLPLTSIESHFRSTAWASNTSNTGIRISAAPSRDLQLSAARMLTDLRALSASVDRFGGMLLPSGGHPFARVDDAVGASNGAMAQLTGPATAGRLWTSGTMIELPFGNEQGFGRMHTAVRMVLPIIPALSAASPFLEGARAQGLSARLLALMEGTAGFPELTASFLPEVVLDQADYYRNVLEPIAMALAERGLADRIDYHAVNQRAAVPAFDRGTIVIHMADTQECVGADVAIAEMTLAVVNAMRSGRWASDYLQRAWHESDLLAILKDVVKEGGGTTITNSDYLLMFGMMRESATADELWRHLYQQLRGELSETARIRIAHILDRGCLAQRILRRTGDRPSREELVETYGELAVCLQEDRAFV